MYEKFSHKKNVKTLLLCNRQSPGLNCAVPVMLFTLEHVRTPVLPSWTLFSMSPVTETCYHQQNLSRNTVAPHKGPRSAGKSTWARIATLTMGWSYLIWTCVSSGWIPQPAHISDTLPCWHWAADVAGFDEWSNGGDGWAASSRPATEW